MAEKNSTRLYKAVDRLSQVGATVAWTLIALVTFADVIGREILSRPIPGGYEIIQVLMTIGVFLSFPIVALRNGHVRVDLLYQRMRPGFRRIPDVLSRLAAVAFFGLLCWAMLMFTQHAHDTGERTVYLHFPHWAAALAMTLALAVTTVCCLIATDSHDDAEPEET